jgi:hypothetical protein
VNESLGDHKNTINLQLLVLPRFLSCFCCHMFRFVSFLLFFEFGLSAKQCDQTAPPMSSVDSWDAASSSFRGQHTKVHRASDEGGDWHGRNNDDEMATGDVGTDSVVATAASVRRARHRQNAPQFPCTVCEANLAKIRSKEKERRKEKPAEMVPLHVTYRTYQAFR